MNATKGVATLSSALVHAGARANEVDRSRHERFIREKLLLVSLVLAALPLVLAFQGVPSPTEAALFALTLMPFAAAGLIGIALCLAAVADSAAAFAWLILAGLEIALAFDRTLLRRAFLVLVPAAGAILAFVVMVVMEERPLGGPLRRAAAEGLPVGES